MIISVFINENISYSIIFSSHAHSYQYSDLSYTKIILYVDFDHPTLQSISIQTDGVNHMRIYRTSFVEPP